MVVTDREASGRVLLCERSKGRYTVGAMAPSVDLIRETPQTAASNIAKLIQAAEVYVVISCGEFSPDVYAQPVVLDACREALRRKVRFDALAGPGIRFSSFVDMLKDRIMVSETRPQLHYLIADSLYVRYEGLHCTGKARPDNDVLWYAPDTAEQLLRGFVDSLKRWKAVPLEQAKETGRLTAPEWSRNHAWPQSAEGS